MTNAINNYSATISTSNALDNAIEAVLKIPNYEKRLIELRLAKKAQFLIITVKNITMEKPIFENGMPLTTKENKALHGYGLKSIELITQKYEGNMSVAIEDGWFTLKIMIPMNQ